MSSRLESAPRQQEGIKTVESTQLTRQINELQKTSPKLWQELQTNLRSTTDLKALGFTEASALLKESSETRRTGTAKDRPQADAAKEKGRIDARKDETRREETRTPQKDSRETSRPKSWYEQRKDAIKTQEDEIKKTGARKVQSGDTLWDIAKAHLKSKSKETPSPKDIMQEVLRLAKINGIKDYNKISTGKTIKMQADKSPGDRRETAPKSGDRGEKPEGDKKSDTKRGDNLDADYRLSETGPNGETVEYDKHGRVTRLKPKDGRPTDFEYDENGKVKKIDFNNGTTIKRRPDGAYVEYKNGMPTGSTWNMDVKVGKDGLIYKLQDGRTTTSTPDGFRSDYDKTGRLTSRDAPNGQRQEFKYDAKGQLSEFIERNPDGKVHLAWKKEGDSWVARDADGKVKTQWKGSLKLDAKGNLEIRDPDGTVKYAGRDLFGRTLKEIEEKARKEKEAREELERRYQAPI